MIKRIPIFIFILILIYFFYKDENFNDKTINIGSSLPKSGIIKSWGTSVTTGANAYIKYANENKLLGDKQINFITYDDKYEPELTLDNINRLIFEDNIYALFGFVGTPTVKSILPILNESQIPFFAPFTGASFLRNNKNPYFMNFRSSYKEEIEHLVEYLHKNKQDKIAVFYQNDNYGEEGYISLLEALKKRNLPLVAEGSYKRNTLSISHAFNEIKNAKPKAIVMVGAYKANAQFIKKAKQNENLKDVLFCNISFGDANEMIKELEKLNSNTENLIFSQVVPYYKDTSIPAIKEYNTLMEKYYPSEPLGFISLEAFFAAKVLVSAISKIDDNLTRQNLIRELRKTPSKLLEGLELKYKNSQLLNNTYIFEYKNSDFRQID